MSEYEIVKSFSEAEAERQFETLQEDLNELMIGDIEPSRPEKDVTVTHDIAIELYDEVSGWDTDSAVVLRSGPNVFRVMLVGGDSVACVEAVLDDLSKALGTDVALRIVAANEQFTQEFLEQTSHRTLYPKTA